MGQIKRNHCWIWKGQCRGSLVAWLTGIVELDPIKYGLLFERFLNQKEQSFRYRCGFC
ncbi:hypothetical protein G3M54_01425 [Bacillus megaterium NBRC 15308 = ATCC 14581]|nr:hypothetical protein [Priestia megaterium NBRC 15308 = ATCC 14581]